MTVVNPKSISGITSITTASGSDNLLTIHTSDANNTERFRIDSTGTTKIVTGIVTTLTATTGIVTTLTTNTTKVGSGITLSSDGHSFVAGVSTTGTLSVSGIVTSTGDVDPTTGTVTTSGNITVGGDLTLESVTPSIKLTDSNQEADNKTFMISGSSTKKLRIQALTDAGGGGGELFEFVRDGNNVYQFQGAKSAIPWFIVNNNTKKVGIGTTIPTTHLHLSAGGGSNVIEMQRNVTNTTGNIGAINFTAFDGHSVASIGAYGAGDNESAYINFKTTTAASANSPFTSTTERLRILSSGGITFNGDTAAANALDDYEEGDWTPKQTDGGTNFTISHAKYVKIGRLVHISFDITRNTSGNTTQVWNLPFLPANYSSWDIGYYAINSGTTNTGTSGYVAGRDGGIVVHTGGGYLHTRIQGGTTQWNITPTDRMIGSAIYETNA